MTEITEESNQVLRTFFILGMKPAKELTREEQEQYSNSKQQILQALEFYKNKFEYEQLKALSDVHTKREFNWEKLFLSLYSTKCIVCDKTIPLSSMWFAHRSGGNICNRCVGIQNEEALELKKRIEERIDYLTKKHDPSNTTILFAVNELSLLLKGDQK